MKVGDIVRQGDKLIKLKTNGKPKPPSRLVGTVIAVYDDPCVPEMWRKTLGKSIDVLWTSGRISEAFAENSLEIVNSFDALSEE